jgi:hypothetical protein
MRQFLVAALLIASVATAAAQSDQYVISRQGSILLMPSYESWAYSSGGQKLSEASGVLSGYFPIGRTMSLAFRAGGASTGGDPAKLSGISDVTVSYAYHAEPLNTVFTLNVNAPTGKKSMERDEFVTSVVLSQSLFNFNVPAFGQGFNIEPGAAWVVPLNDAVVLGLAASYAYRGSYKPRSGLASYDPGDEITGSLGFDFRLGENSSVSTDFALTNYSADKYDGNQVYASGNAYWANIQYKQYYREDELTVLVGVRTKSKGKTAGVGGLVDEKERLEPGRLDVGVSYRHVFNSRTSMAFLLEARWFENTSLALAGAKAIGIGVAPSFGLGGGWYVPLTVKYQYAKLKEAGVSVQGIDAAIGVGLVF